MTNNSNVRLFNNEDRGHNTKMQRGLWDRDREEKKRGKNEDNYYDEPHSTPLHTIIVFIIIRKRMRMPSLYFEHNELYWSWFL